MHLTRTRLVGWLAITLAGAILLSGLASTVNAQSADRFVGALDISMAAEVVGATAPVEVGTAPVVADDQGRPSHAVTVTWNDLANAVLSDERFTHHVSAIEDVEDVEDQFTIRLTYEVTARSAPVDLEVTAQIIEAHAPVSVAVTPVGLDSIGWSHGVRVTWNGAARGMLDDARFAHHVTTDEGDLVTAGRGCSPNWSETTGEVFTACTADLQLIELSAGETHEYPVRVYTEFEALRAGLGTYVVEETVGWEPSNGGARQEFTVRLTYTVTGAHSGPGTFTPEPAASGVTLARWNGGSVAQLPAATSYWVTVQGSYVSYAPSAPVFVNQRFLALYLSGLPVGTIMLVVH